MNLKDLHPNIKIRIIIAFISRLTGNMIFPFMAIYLAYHFGTQMAGLLLLLNVLFGIGITFIGGYFSDQFGRKKIMLWAETLRFFAFVAMMLSNSPWFSSPLITFFMMTVNSLCWGLASPANQAMLIDVSTREQRKLIYSITYWSNNISIAIGGIAGAFLFKGYLFELFMVLSIVAGVVALLITFYIEESYSPTRNERRPREHVLEMIRSYHSVLKDRVFVLFVLAGVFILSLEFQLTNYISIRLSHDMPTQKFLFWQLDGINMTGILRTENTVIVVLLMLFAARLTSRFTDKSILIISCLVFTIGFGIVSYTNNVWILLIFMLILTIGEVLRVPVERTYIASIPPAHARSSYMAFNGLKFNLAMIIASVTVMLSSVASKMIISVFITSIGLIGTFIFYLILPRIESRIVEDEKMAS